MRLLLAIAPLLLAAQCQRTVNPPVPEPATGGSFSTGGNSPVGGSENTGGSATTSACERACARLAELRCESAKPTKAGTTCSQVCENTNASGTLRIDTDCVLLSFDCKTADRCVK